MSCDWVADHIDAYVLDGLEPADRERLDAHLPSCEACRALLGRVRAADERCRAAFAWAEPREGFAEGLARRERWRGRRWWAVAAAAVACLALLGGLRWLRRGSEDLAAVAGSRLSGDLRDAYGEPVVCLHEGRFYEAASRAAVELDDGAFLLVGDGAEFAPRLDAALAVSLVSGTVMAQVDPGQGEQAVELAPESQAVIVRTAGCQFYSSSPSLGRSGRARRQQAEDLHVHVYTGQLELELGEQRLVLNPGDSAIVSDGASAGTTQMLEERIATLRGEIGSKLLARRQRYEQLRRRYVRRLLELRAVREPDGLPYLANRIAVVESLLQAHAHTLARMKADHPALLELDAAEAEMRQHGRLQEWANEALDRFVTGTSSQS